MSSSCKKPRISRNSNRGFTLIELLIVLAIVGIILGVGALNGRQTLRASEERASITTIQQSIWQSATSASARGSQTILSLTDSTLEIKLPDGTLVRDFEIANSVTTNLPQGDFLTFLPPGEIEQTSFNNLTQPITITTKKGSTNLRVSLIGEVVVE